MPQLNVPLASQEVRWFFEGKSTDHAALRRWFETTDPLAKGPNVGAPVWEPREDNKPDVYLVVPGGDDIGIKWREGQLQVKGRVSDLGAQIFCGRHEGRVDRWMKWSYKKLPEAYKNIFVGDKNPGLLRVAVTKERALRKVHLDTMTSVAREVGPKDPPFDRGLGLELTDLTVGGKAYCSLAFEAFPDDSAMSAVFSETVAAFLEGLTAIQLILAQSESYPRWLGRMRT